MVYLRFLISLLRHKWHVFRAGLIVGGIPLWRLIVHDWSKFSPYEFARYASNFQGDYSQSPNDRERVSQDFTLAWLHHENINTHHWGHWIPRSGKYAGVPLDIPKTYLCEMVADWMGASKTYTGSWDMSDWLSKNYQKMELSPQSHSIISNILQKVGNYT